MRRARLFALRVGQGFERLEEPSPRVRKTTDVNEAGALTRALIGLIAIALQVSAATLDQGVGDLAAATRIVIEEDDPLMFGSGHSHPHPMQRARRLVAVEHLHPGLI